MGALYAYERQTPEVAVSKIEGLTQRYQVTDSKTLEFFNVHAEADQWHSEECANILETLKPHEQAEAHEGAIIGAKLLWQFLDEMNEIHSTVAA